MSDREYDPNPMLHHALVMSIAKQFQKRGAKHGLTRDDLFQEGQIGLMRACKDYDPSLGYKVSTYAAPWIKQSIHAALRNAGYPVRLPAYLQRALSCLNRGLPVPLNGLGKPPSDAMLKAGQRALAAECFTGEDTDSIQIEDRYRTESVEDEIDHSEFLRRAMAKLTKKEKAVLDFRYGVNGQPQRLMKDIAKDFGVTKQRIGQIECRALAKMRGDYGA